MKFRKLALLVLALVSFVSPMAYAEHPLGSIKGNQIDLKTSDHAIAGSVRDFVMWGFVDEATFTSNIILRKDGQLVQASFKKQEDGRVGGTIEHTVDNKQILTSLYLVNVDQKENRINLSVNGQPVSVAIAGELKDGHFQNPTYTTVINGEPVSFTLEGDACYGFSFHLVAMVLGAYVH